MHLVAKCPKCRETKTMEAHLVNGKDYEDGRDRYAGVYICCGKKRTVIGYSDKYIRKGVKTNENPS